MSLASHTWPLSKPCDLEAKDETVVQTTFVSFRAYTLACSSTPDGAVKYFTTTGRVNCSDSGVA